MITFTVEVDGLGGPQGDFHSRKYQVTCETIGQAVDKAVDAYLRVHGATYKLYGAKVTVAPDSITVLP